MEHHSLSTDNVIDRLLEKNNYQAGTWRYGSEELDSNLVLSHPSLARAVSPCLIPPSTSPRGAWLFASHLSLHRCSQSDVHVPHPIILILSDAGAFPPDRCTVAAMTRPKVPDDKRQRTAQACETCKRRKQKVRVQAEVARVSAKPVVDCHQWMATSPLSLKMLLHFSYLIFLFLRTATFDSVPCMPLASFARLVFHPHPPVHHSSRCFPASLSLASNAVDQLSHICHITSGTVAP